MGFPVSIQGQPNSCMQPSPGAVGLFPLLPLSPQHIRGGRGAGQPPHRWPWARELFALRSNYTCPAGGYLSLPPEEGGQGTHLSAHFRPQVGTDRRIWLTLRESNAWGDAYPVPVRGRGEPRNEFEYHCGGTWGRQPVRRLAPVSSAFARAGIAPGARVCVFGPAAEVGPRRSEQW